MLPASRDRLLERLRPEHVVLDMGGWADPFGRADWVLDLMPYETRGLYQRNGWLEDRAEPERFSEDTWVVRDICDHEPYPFADGQFDFVICSHTLEDIRDPLWVCHEMSRIAKAGYIEVPSRLEEQSWGVHGEFVGWPHHRWTIDVDEAGIEFVHKAHSIHAREDWYFPAGFQERLTDEERVQILWWQEDFGCRELTLLDREEANNYFGAFVARESSARGLQPSGSEGGGSRRLARRLGLHS